MTGLFFRTPQTFDFGAQKSELLQRNGIEIQILDRDAVIAKDPALAPAREHIAGGLFSVGDESGDAMLFTRALAKKCEAMGGEYKGRPLGQFGRISSFSFYFSHHITTFEGGMCMTADAEIADTLRILRSHGWIREAKNQQRYTEQFPEIDPRFLFVNVGYNLRLTEVQAAVGLEQVPKLEGFLEQRRASAAHWKELFASQGEFMQTQSETDGGAHAWFGFPVTVQSGAPYSCQAVQNR